MEMANMVPEAGRKPTNVSLNTALVAEAKRLGLNISRACEEGLARQIAEERGRLWKDENAERMAAWNDWAESGALPLRRHRQF